MDWNEQPQNIDEHKQLVEAVRAEALALPTGQVSDPDVPVKTLIDEASTSLEAVRQYLEDLLKVGLTATMVDAFARHLNALISAQILWNTERGVSRSEAVLKIVNDSEELRQYILDAGDLALRNDPDAQERLSLIREGEGLADLSLDLGDLAVVLTTHRDEFEAIKLNVDEIAKEAAARKVALQSALAEEDVAKTLTGYKEMRDRCFVLVKRDLQEIRAFARFAFRGDKGNSRRNLFVSAYTRNRDRKARRKAAQKAQDDQTTGE